ncbi:MAG: TetR/AcrR family transcriptional regulator [Kordiimonas sp.]
MGRPVKFDQDAALDTVVDEFWRNGYEASSVKALSEKLGITRSSFYNTFGTREALYKKALHKYFETAPSRAFGETSDGVSAKALITKTFKDICRTRAADNRGCMAVNGVAELAATHAELGPLLKEAILGSTADLENVIKYGIKRKELPDTINIRATALALQNLMMGLNVLCKVLPDEAELWSSAEATLKGLALLDDH